MSEKELYKQLEEYDKTVNKLSKEIKELKEENEIVHKDFNELSEKYFFEKSRMDKALKDTEELYKIAKEQDSENVNLIDRLENILKTLKGE